MSSETDKYRQGVLLIETALERLAVTEKDAQGYRNWIRAVCKSIALEPGVHLFATGTIYVTRGGWVLNLTGASRGIDRDELRIAYNLEGGDPVKDTWCHFPSWE